MTTTKPLLFALLLLSSGAIADETCKHDDQNFRCVKVIRIYDGDTIFADISDTHPLFGKSIGIRVRGLDTAEISTKNACEKRVGLYTKELVSKVLKNAKRVDLENISRGKFFRIVADVIVDGKSISEHLLKQGLAYSYDGGTKKPPDWCKVENANIRTPASKGLKDE